jgi:hypothetical protein
MKGTDTKGTFMAIADLSSAYSFIFLGNLQYAMRFAGRELEIPEWKKLMFERMAMMVLTNSYVETAEGYYKLGKCLPRPPVSPLSASFFESLVLQLAKRSE